MLAMDPWRVVGISSLIVMGIVITNASLSTTRKLASYVRLLFYCGAVFWICAGIGYMTLSAKQALGFSVLAGTLTVMAVVLQGLRDGEFDSRARATDSSARPAERGKKA